MFLVLGFFWIGLALDFSALENFLVQLCYSHLIGFTIPQLLGSQSTDSIVQQVLLLKILCTIAVVIYGALFFFIGNLKTRRSKLQSIYLSVITPIVLFLFYVWSKLISEDHILLREDKIELSQMTIFSFLIVVGLMLLVLRKEKTKLSDTLASKIPTVDDLTNDIQSSPNVDSEESKVKHDTDEKNVSVSSNESLPKEPKPEEKVDGVPSDSSVTSGNTRPIEGDGELPPPPVEAIPGNTEDKAESIGEELPEEDDADLPPPSSEELPPDLAKLQENKTESTVEELPENDDADLPPPSSEELPPDLAKLQEEQNGNAEESGVNSDPANQSDLERPNS